MKSKLKKRKAPDMEGWTYEMVINAGDDLDNSIIMMINTLWERYEVPKEWNKMTIQPIDKTSGWLQMTEKRGLFLTNIVSKCVEKILFTRREDTMIEKLSPYQNGGLKGRSIQDNLFLVNHIIYHYKKSKNDLYLLFADIQKCFDNLWLRDSIIELTRCGTPIQEAMYLYKMNKEVLATVRTPVGETEEVKLEEIVRQGTVGGNKLCIVSTDRINRMGTYAEKDDIRYPIFVDDMLGMGDTDTIKEMNTKMKVLEVTKKYIYNIKKGKTEWMVIRNRRTKKKDEDHIKLEVAEGRIGRTKTYKYLGDMYDEKGNNESKIRHKEEKLDYMISTIKQQSNQNIVGKAATNIRLMLIEAIITPTILSSTETWHNITKQEENIIKQIHQKTLTRILNIPKTTPYMGIISELNITPFIDTIWYKKIMWYYRLIHAENSRISKQILLEQKRTTNNWYTELQQYAKKNKINITEQHLEKRSYNEYKNEVKKKIHEKVVNELGIERDDKTKMRNINPGKKQKYINECTTNEVSIILKIRLHMIGARANYGGGICRECNEEEETTEHVLTCRTNGDLQHDPNKMEDVDWLRKICKIYQQFEDEITEVKKDLGR